MIKTGIGFDAHKFSHDRELVLGGVRVEHEFGLAGHSDADVLSHAICDALLGALADGDIGEHFPDSDSRWKNANSLDLLSSVMSRLKTRQARVVHVDAVLVAERPRLSPYRDQMRANLAERMEVGIESVSVKATTVEKMGALGREEGMAVMAVATVEVGE